MCGTRRRLEGWMGGSWWRVVGNHGGEAVGDGWVDHEGSQISLMSSLQGDLTHSPTSMQSPLIRIFKEKECQQNIFGLCVQHWG